MITDRQVAETAFRRTYWIMAVSASLAVLVICCQLIAQLVGAKAVLPPGGLTAALLTLGFNVLFYPFCAIIRWIVLGWISDKERM